MNCDFTLCRHNNSAELNKEGLCTCKSPKKFCKYLQLKQQIEKMKNWCNCGNYQDCLIQRAEEGKGLKAEECHNCDKWEIKE